MCLSVCFSIVTADPNNKDSLLRPRVLEWGSGFSLWILGAVLSCTY